MNLKPIKPKNGIEKLNFKIDKETVIKLQNFVRLFTEKDWKQWTVRQKSPGGTHAHTEAIRFKWLDFIKTGKYELKNSQNYPGFDELKHILANFFKFVENKYQGKICRVILTKQKPKSVIPKHKDNGPSLVYPHRLHVPVFTDPNIIFNCGTDFINMKVGFAYEINNQLFHEVVNDSENTYKTHFIIDVINEANIT